MEKLRRTLEEMTRGAVVLSDRQLEQFELYYEMLVEKNKVMNLTAITHRDEVIEKHFLDSVALASYLPLWTEEKSVIDVGTGAGFPGLALKIAFPNLKVTLFDSLNKRIRFLQEVIDALELQDVYAIHGRAEEGARKKELRDGFDLVVSRAVANMAVLAEYCLPFVKVGGQFIPYKTDTIDEELQLGTKAISILGGKVEETKKLVLPGTDIHRSFVFIKKKKPTPKTYPRKPGTANKQPLC